MIDENRAPILIGLAERLAAAWKIAGVIDGVSENEIPRDRPEAYFVQDQMAQALGLATTGWKIGATTPMMRKLGGHDGLIPGRLFPQPRISLRNTHSRSETVRIQKSRPSSALDSRRTCLCVIQRGMTMRSAPYITVQPALEIIGNRFSTL